MINYLKKILRIPQNKKIKNISSKIKIFTLLEINSLNKMMKY
jgi:hypothetical protein